MSNVSMTSAPRPLAHPDSSGSRIWRRVLLAALLMGLALVTPACREATASDLIVTQLEFPALGTDAERAAWPLTPSIQGGSDLVIRATALFGCGEPQAIAARAGNRITVRARIAPGSEKNVCAAVIARWEPVLITVPQLPGGEYDVEARVIGHEGAARFRIWIGPSLPGDAAGGSTSP
jgi:hypothetical protein